MEPVAESTSSSLEIKGLQIGWLEKRVALCMDDLFFFLNNPGLSLQGALKVLDDFTEVTGLRVYWFKSLLFPIDPGMRTLALPDVHLLWMEQFKYLGVFISRNIKDFVALILLPILNDVKANLKAWEKLSLLL